jgi:hypothetical protein
LVAVGSRHFAVPHPLGVTRSGAQGATIAVMRLDLDSSVACADGPFGELSDIVIDPGTRRVTHLVVQPPERHYLARLMPIGRVRVDEGRGGVVLDCTVADVNEVKPLHRAEYVRLGERRSKIPNPISESKMALSCRPMNPSG